MTADLADALRQEAVRAGAAERKVRGTDSRLAVVDIVGSDGTVTTTDGIVARRLETYHNPAVDDVIVLSVFSSGTWVAVGRQAPSSGLQFTDYEPTVTGGGSATFSTLSGWYYKVGKLVVVQAYVACSGAGSGTTGITVALPSTPYRGAADIRQYLPAYAGGIAAGTNSATGGTAVGNINPSGSGAVIDQVRSSIDVQYRGNNLSATSTITLNGMYREA